MIKDENESTRLDRNENSLQQGESELCIIEQEVFVENNYDYV
jgi:hypothetical protein